MPVPGQEILHRISEFAASISGDERQSRERAAEVSQDIERLLADQSDAFRELAQHYLPRLEDDVERNGWSEMRGTLREILLRRDDARRQLTGRLQTAESQMAAAEVQWKTCSEELKTTTARDEQLSAALGEQLAADPDFQQLSRAAAEGQARLEQATANLSAVENDVKLKLPAYERSSLFQYLWDSQFGTEHYGRTGLSRRIDRWISRLISYPTAAASYRFLTTAPRMMKQVIDEQQRTVKDAVADVQARQTFAAEVLGLPRTQADLSRLKAEQERILRTLETAQSSVQTLRHDLTALDSPDSPFYRDALAAFQALLQRTERSLVAARAASTPEMTDDQVVARLRHIDDQVREKKTRLDELYAAAELAEQRTARINDLISRCRRAQFDHPKRLFEDSFDLTGRLQSLAAGKVSAETVYQEMYRIQRLDSPIADQASAAINGPMGQILMQTMAQAAGVALGAYAARAGQQHRLPKR